MKKIVVIGGGLAGLISSILLARKGFEVLLFEEKKYPFHRVCGEYISNEVIPFLKSNELYPEEFEPISISKFHLTSPSGKSLKSNLDLGGFGVSRYSFDNWLYQKAIAQGVKFHFDRVTKCVLIDATFQLETREGMNVTSDMVIGAFGKRSNLDKHLNRNFTRKKYPYVGVKYHLKTAVADRDAIALHNFKDGYGGISRIENEKFNLCYLTHRENLKNHGSIPEMEKNVLSKNPFLGRIFSNSDFLFEKPEVINEISFYQKEPVDNHILMVGDSAGMIAPLCGNGMAMAIHSAKIVSEIIIQNYEQFDRKKIEKEYSSRWKLEFERRLWIGRKIQNLFGATYLTEAAVLLNKSIPGLTNFLMKRTHGKSF